MGDFMKNRKNNKLLTWVVTIALILTLIPNVSVGAKIRISSTKKTLYIGDVITLVITGNKSQVKWSSSNKKVADVTNWGTVTALKAGKATIKAKVDKKTLKCKIIVKNRYNDNTPPSTVSTPIPAPTPTPVKDLSDKIEIVKEYTLQDSIGWYTKHIVVIRNNSNETVEISTSSLAYGKDGSIIAMAGSSCDALGAGCMSVICENFETNVEIDHYIMDMTASPSDYYKSVIQDLSYVQNSIKEGAVFQVTNNGQYAARFVKGYALFFLDDKLVDYDWTYFTDNDYEIKPGKTVSNQITSYKEFDRIEFYLDGRR